jgi:hypothetical protein
MLFQFHRAIQLFGQFSLIVCLWLGCEPSFAEESPGAREYQIKATFLMRFGKYVTYPEEAFSNSSSVFNICILGDDPFQGSLDTLVKGEKIQGRWVNAIYLRDVEKTGDCQTLFISSSEHKQLSNIFAYLKPRPILTVSDMKDFMTRGGMIQFYILDNNVRFFIDPVTASEAKLAVSSRLLQVAKVVKKDGGKNQ